MSRFAAALGALVLLAGAFITYINREVLDPDVAGARAEEAIVDDAQLRAAIAAQITASVPDLPIIGGLSTDAVESALSAPAAADALGDSVAITVEDLTSGDRPDPLELNLAQVATEAVTGLASTPLDLVTEQFDSLQIDLSEVNYLLDLLDFVGELEPIGVPLLVIGALLLLASVLLAAGLAEGLLAAGLAVGIASCLGVALLLVGRALLGAGFDEQVTRDAVLEIWRVLGGDLTKACAIGAAAGFAVAAAAGGWLLTHRSRHPDPPRPQGRPTGTRASRRAATVIRPRDPGPPPPPPRS